MKKLLFVIPSLGIGGAEKSLYGLLKYWDYNKYEVYVYPYVERGDYCAVLPKEVKVIEPGEEYRDFFCRNMFSSCWGYLSRFRLRACWRRLKWGLLPFLYRLVGRKCHRNSRFDWSCQQMVMEKLSQDFDVAIGYMEGAPNYYVVNCVNASKKIAWIHTDYSTTFPNLEADRAYLPKTDAIVTVSQNSKREIVKLLPELAEKIQIIPNILDTNKIDRLKNDVVKLEDAGRYRIVSVGRLVKLKGFDICIEAAKILCDKGLDFHWYFVGDGPEKEALDRQIRQLGLEEKCTLAGATDNPYAFMNRADCCVQMSEYEGRSMVIDEEHYLLKPIVASNIGSYRETIDDGRTGLLVERNPVAAAMGILRLLEDSQFYASIVANLVNLHIDDGHVIQAVETLLK